MKPTFQVYPFLQAAALTLFLASIAAAQAPEGPQSDAPPPATTPATRQRVPPKTGQTILVPTGTRIGVVLESGISTATAKAGRFRLFPHVLSHHYQQQSRRSRSAPICAEKSRNPSALAT